MRKNTLVLISIVLLVMVEGVPGMTKIQPRLTPLAALGLMVTMVGAIIFHIPRGEFLNIPLNVVLFLISGFVAYGRWRLHPLPSRDS